MKLVKYNTNKDIDVEFEDGTIISNRSYSEFKNGKIRNRMFYYPNPKEDLVGREFGRLIVVELNIEESLKKRNIYWTCSCCCGNIKIAKQTALMSKNKKTMVNSCGCLKKEVLIERNKDSKYKDKKSQRLLSIWTAMKDRCYSEKNKKYEYYGGRGISICQEWLDDYSKFEKWSFDNGYGEKLTIDRINFNGSYEPKNCRWVDMKVQNNNKNNNKYIEYNGETKTLSEWCDELGLPYGRTKARINTLNMSPEEAFVKGEYHKNGSKEVI
ncbi:MAG: hypothetical protein ACRCTZ_18385 [Sarcina sp.]